MQQMLGIQDAKRIQSRTRDRGCSVCESKGPTGSFSADRDSAAGRDTVCGDAGSGDALVLVALGFSSFACTTVRLRE